MPFSSFFFFNFAQVCFSSAARANILYYSLSETTDNKETQSEIQ
jgi:hypothetical protein